MNSPAAVPPSRILLALANREFDEFLPEPLRGEVHQLFPDTLTLDPALLSADEWAGQLRETNPAVLVACWSTPPLPPELPARLRYVCHLGGSTRSLVNRRQLEHGLLVTNWGPSVARTVAEGALSLMLSSLRRMPAWTLRLKRDGGWRTGDDRVESLFGRRVGVHGFGFVARELVRLLRPFGNVVSVFAPDATDELLAAHNVERVPDLATLFAGNEVVVELAALTPTTRGCVGRRELASLRPGALFVNVARGPIVDERALLEAAGAGRILIGLDVYHEEPLPPDSPLRTLPNVTLSPHVAGPTNDRRSDAGAFALENLRAWVAGRPLRAVVTPEIYDLAT